MRCLFPFSSPYLLFAIPNDVIFQLYASFNESLSFCSLCRCRKNPRPVERRLPTQRNLEQGEQLARTQHKPLCLIYTSYTVQFPLYHGLHVQPVHRYRMYLEPFKSHPPQKVFSSLEV